MFKQILYYYFFAGVDHLNTVCEPVALLPPADVRSSFAISAISFDLTISFHSIFFFAWINLNIFIFIILRCIPRISGRLKAVKNVEAKFAHLQIVVIGQRAFKNLKFVWIQIPTTSSLGNNISVFKMTWHWQLSSPFPLVLHVLAFSFLGCFVQWFASVDAEQQWCKICADLLLSAVARLRSCRSLIGANMFRMLLSLVRGRIAHLDYFVSLKILKWIRMFLAILLALLIVRCRLAACAIHLVHLHVRSWLEVPKPALLLNLTTFRWAAACETKFSVLKDGDFKIVKIWRINWAWFIYFLTKWTRQILVNIYLLIFTTFNYAFCNIPPSKFNCTHNLF